MKARLLRILNHLGYSATKFADEINVQRSGISHILSGRNQPSYDFLVKILTRFSDINAEWLLLGTGDMFKPKLEETNSPVLPKNEPDLFSASLPLHENAKLNETTPLPQVTNVTNVDIPVERILLLKQDGTFDIYQQSKKV